MTLFVSFNNKNTQFVYINYMNMAEKLRSLRKQKGLSAKEVATELNITRSAYTNYECGIRLPAYEILIKICKFFDITSDYLLGIDEDSI